VPKLAGTIPLADVSLLLLAPAPKPTAAGAASDSDHCNNSAVHHNSRVAKVKATGDNKRLQVAAAAACDAGAAVANNNTAKRQRVASPLDILAEAAMALGQH
jgi:hypothetical protein